MLLVALFSLAGCQKDDPPNLNEVVIEQPYAVQYDDGTTNRPWTFHEDGRMIVGEAGDWSQEVYTYKFISERRLELQLVGMNIEGVYLPDAIPCCQYNLDLTPLPNGDLEGLMQSDRPGTIPIYLLFKKV